MTVLVDVWQASGTAVVALQINASTGAFTTISFNSSAAWTAFQADATYLIGTAFVYDAIADCFYFYVGGNDNITDSRRVFKITPNGTTTWDMTTLSTTGVTPAYGADYQGAQNRFFYIPRWRCLFYVEAGNSVYYMRVA